MSADPLIDVLRAAYRAGEWEAGTAWDQLARAARKRIAAEIEAERPASNPAPYASGCYDGMSIAARIARRNTP